jgi:hypothetical protein
VAAAFLMGLAATTSSSAAELTGPLAPAASGHALCFTPDPSTKTCESTATYRVDAAGVIQNTAVLLFLENTTVETTTPVVIKGDQVCGAIRAEDAAAAKVVANDGSPVDPQKQSLVRGELKLDLENRFGQQICTAFVQTEAGLMAQATVDGERNEGLERMVIWVSPEDGYRVAP